MKVVIAEKPDQATKLAAPFSFTKNDGYLMVKPNTTFPNGAVITWAIGHLCELKSPEEYHSTWKKWDKLTLPMVPNRFEYKVTKSKLKQFNIIKNILKRAEVQEIIIAGDAGREGELIIRTIIKQCGVSIPMKRLWISSLTQASVMKGFSSLLTEEDTRHIYFEALSRACADWLIGINSSRIYTILLKERGIQDVFSIGRVQTPTLALIVKREHEIANFKPEDFWEVEAQFNFLGQSIKAKWHKKNETKIYNENQAIAVAEFCKDKNSIISDVKKERKEYQPPFLFNLSALQATANKTLKLSPQKTLDILQKLYLKGNISYPRSDSQYLTTEEAAVLPTVLSRLKGIERYENLLPPPNGSIINNKRYVNEKKVTDHHAIIPTEQIPDHTKLSSEEAKIYDLIVRQVISAFYNNAIFNYTTIHILVDNRATFIAKGKEQIEEGWKKVINHPHNQSDGGDQILPIIEKNTKGTVAKVNVKKGQTKPPKRYTEGNLITLMKTAGKHLDDTELENVLAKTEGLGTEATRAGIINLLKNRNYIDINKNQTIATAKGMLLIEALGDSILASPSMTAKWEQRLSEIGEGSASPRKFIEQVKKLSQNIVEDAQQHSHSWSFTNIPIETVGSKQKKSKFNKKKISFGKCKMCNGSILDFGNFYGCTNYKKSNCKFTISKKILGKTVSQTNIKKLLKTGETNVIKNFKKDGKTFDAIVLWSDRDKRIVFKYMK
ncbi:DNA topoisomerase III [Cytobacillus sp. IB215665]|uniref:DNA topoisomerase III n=1 Tax=Cytobacillus sp. IB215665 TaxID=3097357 RepID=UPI002A1043CB|nr:DNA topoisomerase III [Cytobacillus sp. IB215665]MDX8366518.1 DNA topoisomerase III [Cytobacillus sp. IB215665]